MKNLIGNTPLIPIPHPNARILVKLERLNPFGSSKDRAVARMLDAVSPMPGQILVEATSGNTGISLAALCAQRNYRCIIVMPENMSRERMLLMKCYGAQVLLTPADQGMIGAVQLAQHLARDCGGIYLDQFHNPANAAAHYETTGPEIWAGSGKQTDLFIAGIGTGGTIRGAGQYLREQNSRIRIIGVEPASGQSIPGIGAGFSPPLIQDFSLDGRIFVSAGDALAAAKKSGLGCGVSSGASLCAALQLASLPENTGKTIAAILPDSIERYLSLVN